MFNHYRIPREALLNKTGDVTPDGRYVSPIEDDNLRFGEWPYTYPPPLQALYNQQTHRNRMAATSHAVFFPQSVLNEYASDTFLQMVCQRAYVFSRLFFFVDEAVALRVSVAR